MRAPHNAWTILQQDGPNHLGLWCNALPEHQKTAPITSGCVPCSHTAVAAEPSGPALEPEPEPEQWRQLQVAPRLPALAWGSLAQICSAQSRGGSHCRRSPTEWPSSPQIVVPAADHWLNGPNHLGLSSAGRDLDADRAARRARGATTGGRGADEGGGSGATLNPKTASHTPPSRTPKPTYQPGTPGPTYQLGNPAPTCQPIGALCALAC